MAPKTKLSIINKVSRYKIILVSYTNVKYIQLYKLNVKIDSKYYLQSIRRFQNKYIQNNNANKLKQSKKKIILTGI